LSAGSVVGNSLPARHASFTSWRSLAGETKILKKGGETWQKPKKESKFLGSTQEGCGIFSSVE